MFIQNKIILFFQTTVKGAALCKYKGSFDFETKIDKL